MQWNSPFGPLAQAKSLQVNSDSIQQVLTPPGFTYSTPPSAIAKSPRDAPSPLTEAIQRASAQNNTKMLIKGEFEELLNSLSKKDKT
jgi:hypothetical protein